jgi:hypothetical protein
MGCHQPTKDYVARRTAEGKTKTEIMRCLKRYIAREVFPHLPMDAPAHLPASPTRADRVVVQAWLGELPEPRTENVEVAVCEPTGRVHAA